MAAALGITAGAMAAGVLAAGVLAPAAPAAAATPTLPSLVAYVRGGDVYVSRGAAETRLTRDGGWSRPRWSPDGQQLALLRAGQLWTMKSDGSSRRQLTTRPAAGPAWSPDGRWLAFASLSCSGGPGVYRVPAGTAGTTPQVLFPADCREEPLPAAPATATAVTGPLTDRLRVDDAVAWSPDGTKVAFRGGACESVYDACLSVGTLATGGERTVAAYGGGSRQNSGFAVMPAWRPDGNRLAYTAFQIGETTAENEPVHVVEHDLGTGARRTVGAAQDRELAYVDARSGLVTGQYKGGSWVLLVNLTTGARTPFHPGSQPSVQPRG